MGRGHSYRRGASGQSYALILGLIAVVGVLSIQRLGLSVNNLFCSAANGIGGSQGCMLQSIGSGSSGGSPGAGGGAATLTLTGTGSGMNVTGPGNPAYGAAVGFTLTNTGAATSATPAVSLSPATNFAVTVNGCAAGLAPGASCTITVRPQATANGSLSATLTVTADNNPTLALSGTAAGFNSALASCQAWRDLGYTASGSYSLDPDGAGTLTTPANAYCAMSGADGWTLIAYNDAPTSFTGFNQNWASYKAGFGGPSSGAQSLGWIGNDRLNALTSGGRRMRVLAGLNGGGTATHLYEGFTVGNEAGKYVMSFSTGASPDANDGGHLAYHSGRPFTTLDNDNDAASNNCAVSYASGWWHGACYRMSIAGTDSGRVYWRDAAGSLEPVYGALSLWVR